MWWGQAVYAPRAPLWLVVLCAALIFSGIQYALLYLKYTAYQGYVKHHPMYKQKEAQLQRQLDAGEITEEEAVVDVKLVGAEEPKVLDMIMFQMPFYPYRCTARQRPVPRVRAHCSCPSLLPAVPVPPNAAVARVMQDRLRAVPGGAVGVPLQHLQAAV